MKTIHFFVASAVTVVLGAIGGVLWLLGVNIGSLVFNIAWGLATIVTVTALVYSETRRRQERTSLARAKADAFATHLKKQAA